MSYKNLDIVKDMLTGEVFLYCSQMYHNLTQVRRGRGRKALTNPDNVKKVGSLAAQGEYLLDMFDTIREVNGMLPEELEKLTKVKTLAPPTEPIPMTATQAFEAGKKLPAERDKQLYREFLEMMNRGGI